MTIQDKIEELITKAPIHCMPEDGVVKLMLEFAEFCCEEQKKECAESYVTRSNGLGDDYSHASNEYAILNCKNVVE